MKKKGLLLSLIAFFSSVQAIEAELTWDDTIPLDAEALAESGIRETYEQYILPHLCHYVVHPLVITEKFAQENMVYSVFAGDKNYDIFGSQISEPDTWGRATWAIFSIVNQQLADSDIRFYALDNGNGLAGMFLTQQEYQRYVRVLEKEKKYTDIPYIPTDEPPWFGQRH